MSLHYHCHSTLNDIKKLESKWNTLHNNCLDPSTYNQFNFVYLSIKHFQCNDAKPFVLSIHYQDQLIGIFFLQHCLEHRMGIRVKVIEFCALDEIDKPFPVIHVNHIDRCWTGFFSFLNENRDWDILNLIEQNSTTIQSLSDLAQKNSMPYRINPDKSGPILDLSQPWDAFWSKHKKMRKKLYKMEKDFPDRMEFKVLTGLALLDDYIQVEQRSWKQGKIGINSDPRTLSFYRSLIQQLNSDAYIGILYIDDLPVSAEIAYACNDSLYFCHGCYDQTIEKYSPGMISTSLFLKYFMDSKCFRQGDFLVGYAGYLNAWSDIQLHTQRIDIYKPNWVTRLFFTLRVINKLTPSPVKQFAKGAYALLKNNP